MELAVTNARRTACESNGDPHVAALAVDGNLLGVAFRCEQHPGDHAEYTLLEKKLTQHALAGATIYTTLEPCTVRKSSEEIPCAERLRSRQIARVYVGMLDPNRQIS